MTATNIVRDMVRDLFQEAVHARPDLKHLYYHSAAFNQAIRLTEQTLVEVVMAMQDERMEVREAARVVRTTWSRILDREQRAARTDHELLRHAKFERIEITPAMRAWAQQQIERIEKPE